MRLPAAHRKRARIEMVPLIDAVFLLLVFFIYAMLTMTVHRGVKVELPRAGQPPVELAEHVVVTIDAAGRLYVNRQPVEEGELRAAVEQALAASPRRLVVIDGDRSATLGIGVRVLEWLSHLEDIRVAFSVEPEGR